MTTFYRDKSFRVGENNYDDMLGDIRTAASGAAQWQTAQIGDTGFIINWLQDGQNDYAQMTLQMTHRKKLQTSLADFHIHYVLSAAPEEGQTVKIEYAYTWDNIGAAIPAIASWTADTKTLTFTGAELANTHYILSVLEDVAPPANETVSSIFMIKLLRRSQGAPADTYAGNFGLLNVDCHILCDRVGSLNPTSD